MDSQRLFEALLHADQEDEVTAILKRAGYLNDADAWRPFGGIDNNIGAISNQQADPTAALVEKVINAIDAVLMRAAFARHINPEGPQAPVSMSAAVEQFFHVKEGKFENVTAEERTKVAENIHLIAVGSKSSPSYLVIDMGEGQTPRDFPNTLVSLLKSNKMRIPFVQGKYNTGGTGVLQFCGRMNYQLIVSRRCPEAPSDAKDPTASQWGFTIVRRVRPAGQERSSFYTYLAPGGAVPSFAAKHIMVLPAKSQGPNQPPDPYRVGLEYGTCIKLYDYRWQAKSTATTEARYELETMLHSPCLPFRVTETRDYRANYYSTTVAGVWVSVGASRSEGSELVEEGFPSYGDINLPQTGQLPYSIVAYTDKIDPRHFPHGVYFTVNGQVHGELPADFVSRRLKFDYLKDYLLVSVDCTGMEASEREDFFMASRDRTRRNDVYYEIMRLLEQELREHEGIKALNAARRAKQIADELKDDAGAADVLQQLLKLDPTLASLLGFGSKVKTKVKVPIVVPQPKFIGKKFPTYFRLKKGEDGSLTRECAVNRSARIELVTDAVNDYFKRPDSHGRLTLSPAELCEHSVLWNGVFSTQWRPPLDAQPGDSLKIRIEVDDDFKASTPRPLVSEMTLRFTKAQQKSESTTDSSTTPKNRRKTTEVEKEEFRLGLPNIVEVPKADWPKHKFTASTGLRIKHGAKPEDGYDYLLNVDNGALHEQLARAKPGDGELIRYWFKWGLALCAMGMLQEAKTHTTADKRDDEDDDDESSGEVDLETIGRHSDGLARVIIPIIKTLKSGPAAAAA